MKLGTTAGLAMARVPAIPPHAHPLARRPFGHARTHSINHSDHLVSWDTGVLEAGPEALFDERVGGTNATGVHLDPNLPGAGLRDLSFDQFKWSARSENWTARILAITPPFYSPLATGAALRHEGAQPAVCRESAPDWQ